MTRMSPFVALLSAFLPASALALGGVLDRPGLAVPQGTDLRLVHDVLSAGEFDYVTGWFINAHSVLYYSGDATDLNRFLAALTACDGIDVALRFSAERGVASSNFPAGDQGVITAPCRWSVEHNAWGAARRLTVTVFLGDGEIALPDLNLPDWHGRGDGPAVSRPPFPDPLVPIATPPAAPAEAKKQ